MQAVLKIIHRVCVLKFYERHAALLAFVFYVMFGLVQSNELIDFHQGLIFASLTSPLFYAAVLGVWTLYLIKIILFYEECFSLPQNSILKNFGLLAPRSQWMIFSYAIILAYLPVLIYSLFMIRLAFQHQLIGYGLSIIVFHSSAIGLGSWRLMHVINSTSSFALKMPRLWWGFRKPLPLIYLGLLANRLKLTFLLTKLSSVVCILCLWYLPVDHYEPRLAWLGLAFGLAGHGVILFEWRKFEDREFFFSRALPLATSYRFAMIGVAFLLLLIPESIVMFAQGLQIVDVSIGLVIGTAFLLFIYCTSYRHPLNNEQHLQRMLWLFLISFLMILSKFSIPFSILLLAVAWWQFKKHFDAYQPVAD